MSEKHALLPSAIVCSIDHYFGPEKPKMSLLKRKSLMNRDFCELNRMVLEAVSRDFEPFESLVSQLSVGQACSRGKSYIDRIESNLLESIADEHIRAYLIHADPPYVTTVEVNSDTVRRYWFLITEKGKKFLQELLEREASALERNRSFASNGTRMSFRISKLARRQPAGRH